VAARTASTVAALQKLTKTAAIGGDMLAVKDTDAEQVAKLITATTGPAGGGGTEVQERVDTMSTGGKAA
jgi:hypothetical protein